MGFSGSLSRREVLRAAGAAGAAMCWPGAGSAATSRPAVPQPIRGSWISILWDDRRHLFWNEQCRDYSAEQWAAAVRDVAEVGMEYLVLLAVAKGGEAFYDTPLLPKAKLACADPIEAMLAEADACGVKFFMSSDWYAGWDEAAVADPERMKVRVRMMGELAAKYSHHTSFHGWYWPNEAYLTPYFTEPFVKHINACSAEAHKLTPKARTLTAPYGTHKAVCDDRFIRQLDGLDVDIIAYQDEVGCLRATPDEIARCYERLRQAHDKVPQRALWADVEVFAWEGPPNKQSSPLIPAPFDRVERQLEAASPFVDRILIYQYQGLLSKPGSAAPAGPPQAEKLYRDYVAWLAVNHPGMLRRRA
ncbi:MAG: DUF4434 domain-containing protein [Phycisphaerae bacterium]|nr:DUF4434 domain-containing protein [Phycisphaerae bacterium]